MASTQDEDDDFFSLHSCSDDASDQVNSYAYPMKNELYFSKYLGLRCQFDKSDRECEEIDEVQIVHYDLTRDDDDDSDEYSSQSEMEDESLNLFQWNIPHQKHISSDLSLIRNRFWNWEYKFFRFAAHKFLQLCLDCDDPTEKLSIPIPKCFKECKKDIGAKLVCTTDKIEVCNYEDAIAINGRVLEPRYYESEINREYQNSRFDWKNQPFACILHYLFSNENSNSSRHTTELILPSREFIKKIKHNIADNEKRNILTFEEQISKSQIPMFPFSALNRYPSFHGNQIRGISVGLSQELIYMKGKTNSNEIGEIWEACVGTGKKFVVWDYARLNDRNPTSDCLNRALQYTINALQSLTTIPAVMGDDLFANIVQLALEACQAYRMHFENCICKLN